LTLLTTRTLKPTLSAHTPTPYPAVPPSFLFASNATPSPGEFEVIVWGEEITQDLSIPVEAWPKCDCLISFTSSGFPLTRVEEYVALRKPYCINDVTKQSVFNNRHTTYLLLEMYKIPTFRRIYADRRNGRQVRVVETDDCIEIDGQKMRKPIVEKPFDGSDHNIFIYYSKAQVI
jgi:inositol-hexakisphosphate/diphosphoinositol-pentakisphosphate 1-kinase